MSLTDISSFRLTLPMNEKLKSLFGDLGKPTLRGVRKCPKCGTFNGTRGISCKNKSCNAVFKEIPDRKKVYIEAAKIITGSTAQVYSVRVRDRGPDYRGFVQLPLLPADTSAEQTTEQAIDPNPADQTARCFVDTCQKLNSVQKIPAAADLCQHIKAALQCFTEAEPLSLKNSILNALQVSNEVKQDIWSLATETTGPLVQRVSKNVMVVKCKANPKHPLGFLHFTFYETARNRDTPDHKFHCNCRTFRAPKAASKEEVPKHCIHYYACICAFASNEKLAEDFSYYINEELVQDGSPEQQLLKFLSDTQPPISDITENQEVVLINTVNKRKLDENTAAPAPVVEPAAKLKKAPARKLSAPQKKCSGAHIDETQVSMTFHQWLSNITERINQTMHYQFCGTPEPLVFHAPQVFFDCVQQRISAGSKKKRLPNSTTGFVRKDALPLGTFSKYTWHITNILHVKKIFDTPEVPLQLTQNFVENRDGTYDLYEPPTPVLENSTELFCKTENKPLIKPFELKTFLKVGNSSTDQKEPTPFIIEWIPDILPKTKIGELRIKFEYGHQRNGIVEHRIPNTSHIIHIQSL